MKGWRRNKRQKPTQQPNLPGLFAPLNRTRRLATPHEQALDIARGRLTAVAFVFALGYLVICARLADLTLLSDVPPDVPMAHNDVSDSVASRADITDRNGVVLATSLPTISLCADAPKIVNQDDTKKQLLSVLPDLDADKLEDALNSGKHCAMIRRHLTPRQYYAVNKLGIIGLEFRPDERRIYPAGNIAAHVVGFTNIDNYGLAGIEDKLNTQLQERQSPVALSLDLRVQTILHNELSQAIGQYHAIGGAGLVMDISTGEILGMVSLPDFDPAHPGNADDDARFNRDTLGVYEMGSTFKIFNTAMALDSGLVHLGDSFDTTHPIEVGSQTIRDFETEKRWLNVAEIFTHSSNIGSAHMVEKLGGARQRAFLGKLGLTDKASLELPEIGAPLVPSAANWTDSTTMTVAFGHGIAVNAVQLTGAIATIVNNGMPVRPTLLKKTEAEIPTPEDRVISPHTSAIMRGLMRLVVTRGTGKGAEVAGYLVGGKTGTADKIVNHRYSNNARLSSFVGIFPLNAPHYLVFALLDDPKGNAKTYGFATGGMVAAPVVSHIIGQMGPLLGVEPLDADMEASAERQLLRPLGAEIVDGLPVDEGSNYASRESDSVQ
jgi:cell division protein FtsI (penicillin-binding protein 3)